MAELTLSDIQKNPGLVFHVDYAQYGLPDERLKNIKRRLLENKRRIDLERARLTTESYRQTEGEPMPIRRAEMLLHLVREMPIAIYADERIVGNRSLLPRMGVIAPEGAVNWIDRELEACPPARRIRSTSRQKRSTSCARRFSPTGAARRWKTWSPSACPSMSPR